MGGGGKGRGSRTGGAPTPSPVRPPPTPRPLQPRPPPPGWPSIRRRWRRLSTEATLPPPPLHQHPPPRAAAKWPRQRRRAAAATAGSRRQRDLHPTSPTPARPSCPRLIAVAAAVASAVVATADGAGRRPSGTALRHRAARSRRRQWPPAPRPSPPPTHPTPVSPSRHPPPTPPAPHAHTSHTTSSVVRASARPRMPSHLRPVPLPTTAPCHLPTTLPSPPRPPGGQPEKNRLAPPMGHGACEDSGWEDIWMGGWTMRAWEDGRRGQEGPAPERVGTPDGTKAERTLDGSY